VSERDRSGGARDDAVVAALHRLAPHLDGEPDPDFRAATRARLVAMAAVRSPEPEPASALERLLAAGAGSDASARWRSRLTAGLAGAALTVTAAASFVAVSSGARPGDVLYGLKRGTEQTQLALAGDARGRTLLDFASTRLVELEGLVDEGPSALPAAGGGAGAGDAVLAAGADPELVISTLETMDEQTTEGTAWLTDRAVTTEDGGPLDDVSGWVTEQTDGLTALAPQLPDAAGAAVSHSLALLSDVSARATGLQRALSCPSGPAVGPADALGPAPAACPPAPPGTPGEQTGTGAPGSGSAESATTTAAPSPPPAGGAGSGGAGGSAGVPAPGTTVPGTTVPGVPTVPGLPTITVPGGLPPSLSVPGLPLPGATSEAVGELTGALPLPGCLPPVGTLGDC
jgi:hypothetical protein